MANEDRGESSGENSDSILLDSSELSPVVDLAEGPVFDRRMVELVEALAGCDAGDAEHALQCTAELEDGDPMAWCSRAVVRLRRMGLI